MESLFAQLRLADVNDDVARNIVSLRSSEDLFDDLSENPADQRLAMAVEMSNKPPTYRSEEKIIRRPFEEAEWQDAIGYPFEHWSESRYSTGRFGVWYGAESIETTVHETVYHWRRFLADANWDTEGSRIERKVYRVRCRAALLDLRPATENFPALVHPHDYTQTQQIGARLHREGHPGVVTRSARYAGDVYAVLNPLVLSNPRAACFLTYCHRGDGVVVERETGTTWMQI